jgi:hypothetical protein
MMECRNENTKRWNMSWGVFCNEPWIFNQHLIKGQIKLVVTDFINSFARVWVPTKNVVMKCPKKGRSSTMINWNGKHMKCMENIFLDSSVFINLVWGESINSWSLVSSGMVEGSHLSLNCSGPCLSCSLSEYYSYLND